VVSIAVVLGTGWAFAISKAVQVRRQPVSVGPQQMIGEIGEFRGDGQVFVRGELWRARVREGSVLKRGEKVRVDAVDPSLVLDVEPVESVEPADPATVT
jgi:membrane-bound ClpP family serine protease